MAIQIETQETEKNLIGRSHWWGAPDLPEGIPYPYVTITDGNEKFDAPLTFICQIRCDEISAFDTEHLLPEDGMLYFFAPIDYFMGEDDSPLDYHEKPVVIYSPEADNLKPYVIKWEGSDESIFRPAEEMLMKSVSSGSLDGMVMLGKPYQEDLALEHEDDICLLQIDSEDKWNLRFFDMGMYYFFISKEALSRGAWNKTVGELFTY